MAIKLSPEFLDRHLFTLTVREFLELNELTKEKIQEPELQGTEKPLKGINALADFLKVSVTTAQKLKNSGKIPYSQFGKNVWFDGNEVKKALRKN